MRNVKTREGFKYWDKICSLTSYGFLHSPDNQRILKTPDIGNWIDKHEAQTIVDEAQDEINELQAQLATVTKDAEQGRVSGMTAIADLQRRNKELTGLLEEALGSVYVDAGKCDSTQVWKETVDLAARIEIAIKPTEPAAVTLCLACDGAGSVSTGIAEASSTICNKCDGTGTKPTESGASE